MCTRVHLNKQQDVLRTCACVYIRTVFLRERVYFVAYFIVRTLPNNKITIYYLWTGPTAGAFFGTFTVWTDFRIRPLLTVMRSGVRFVVYAIFYQTNVVYGNEVFASSKLFWTAYTIFMYKYGRILLYQRVPAICNKEYRAIAAKLLAISGVFVFEIQREDYFIF